MLREKLKQYNIILGSQSPRRKGLLAGLDIPFTVQAKAIDESFSKDMDIKKVAEYLANQKAEAFNDELKVNDLLITSDTTVCLENGILNKARDDKEASIMLQSISGRVHEVITGVCIKTSLQLISFSEVTKVHFKSLSHEEIDYYISKHQPFDKAGAYGIQEWIGFIGINKIEGDYYNVMGLPLNRLYSELQNL